MQYVAVTEHFVSMDHPFGLLVLPNDPPKGGFELSKMMSIHTHDFNLSLQGMSNYQIY
jgi:hypothetical protein